MKIFINQNLYELVDLLAENIKKSPIEDIFDFPVNRIVIPSLVNRNWISMQVAKRNGISVKMEFDTLEWSPYRIAKEIYVKNLPENLTSKDLFFQVLMVLSDKDFINKDEMKSVRKYIEDDDKSVSSVKKYQLAAKIADLFIKYMENTPEIIYNWKKGQVESEREEERIQFLIYQKLVESKKEVKANLLLEDFDTSEAKYENKIKIHVFGYPYISMPTLKTLEKLSEFIDINIYVQKLKKSKISEEYKGINGWMKIQDKFIENLYSVENTEIFFSEKTEEKPQINVLECLKNLKTMENKINQDKSFQIGACPSVYREVESVWNSVIYNLENNPKLKLEDIGILLCDTQKYYPSIASVFDREKQKVPYNSACVLPKQTSSYLQGIKSLFNLIDSNFTLKDIKTLITNPCFQEKFYFGKDTVEEWLDIAEELSIFEFFDKDHKNSHFNTEIFSKAHTWNQATERINLGKIMNSDEEKIWKDTIPFTKTFYNFTSLNKITLIIEKLYYECKDIKNAVFKEPKDSIYAIKRFINSFLSIKDSGKEELKTSYFLDKLLNDFLFECNSRNYVPSIYDIPNYLENNLTDTIFSQGKPFTNGIIIGHIRNIRMPDFKILYILGLNEGTFPENKPPSSLDLATFKENNITEKDYDQYTLFKIISAAKEKLYISYVAKDTTKDTQKFPSSSVIDIIDFLNKNVLLENFKEVEMPLFGRSSKYYAKKEPAYTDLMINYYKLDNNLAKIESGEMSIDEGLYLFSHKSEEESALPLKDPVKIDAKYISDFLENPLEYALKRKLKLSDWGENSEFENQKPPLKMDSINFSKILKENVYNIAKEENFKDIYKKYKMKGLAPEAIFGEIEEGFAWEKILKTIEKIDNIENLTFYRNVNIGNNKTHKDEPCINFPSIILNIKNCKVEITGSIPLFAKNQDENILFLVANNQKEYRIFSEMFVLYALYFFASKEEKIYSIYSISPKDKVVYSVNKVIFEELQTWLSNVLEDMLSVDHLFDYLPIDIIVEKLSPFKKESEEPFDNKEYYYTLKNLAEESIHDSYKNKYLHYIIRDLPFIAKVPINAREKIHKRFEFIVNHITKNR